MSGQSKPVAKDVSWSSKTQRNSWTDGLTGTSHRERGTSLLPCTRPTRTRSGQRCQLRLPPRSSTSIAHLKPSTSVSARSTLQARLVQHTLPTTAALHLTVHIPSLSCKLYELTPNPRSHALQGIRPRSKPPASSSIQPPSFIVPTIHVHPRCIQSLRRVSTHHVLSAAFISREPQSVRHARYCSRACQKQDWRVDGHKKVCQEKQAIDDWLRCLWAM